MTLYQDIVVTTAPPSRQLLYSYHIPDVIDPDRDHLEIDNTLRTLTRDKHQ